MDNAALPFIRAMVGLASFALFARALVAFFSWRARFSHQLLVDGTLRTDTARGAIRNAAHECGRAT